MKSRLFLFIFGMLSGILLVLAAGILLAVYIPSLLIVDEAAHQADIAVVLGGGGGSRFRKGLSLYDVGLVDHLLLVDNKKNAWDHMLRQFCPDCAAEGKIVILEGSKDTFTDAELVEHYCREHNINSMLVVTDPYHTRRAALIFKAQFTQSDIRVTVVSSGDFGSRLSPDEYWWQDDATLKTVWTEMNKVLIVLLRKLSILTGSRHQD